MASLLKEPLFEISGQGPSPNNSFYYFAVTRSNVIWRWWKISARSVDRFSRPGELKQSHNEFVNDNVLQCEVGIIFGHRLLDYIKALCQGHYDYLDHMPNSLLLRIINYLDIEDVVQLGRTSRKFRQLCRSEQAVCQRCNTVSAELVSLAKEMGRRKIFTN